ncbi:hypothetical protein HK101_002866 [Irineochytrium annulatum]|nr:hypothetical protein HK101_002866 [Irineochytrium annulatum]
MGDDGFDTSYESLMALGERMGDVRNKGLSDTMIQSLPVKIYRKPDDAGVGGGSGSGFASGSEEDNKCAICLSEFEGGEELTGLPCCHYLHKECLDPWLKVNKVCPICRTQVDTN